MKTYNLAKEIAVVQVYNSDSLSYQIYQTTRTKVVYFDIPSEIKQVTLPKGRWVELCLAKEMTEEKAKTLFVYNKARKLYGYTNEYYGFWFISALSVFRSFMQSIGMPCQNPYGSEPIIDDYRDDDVKAEDYFIRDLYAWQEAEAKLVNTVILYKEK